MLFGIETAILIILVLIWIYLLFNILQLLKKLVVTVTVVSVDTNAASYDHGDTVNISGAVKVDDAPQVSASVALKVKDSAGTEYVLPGVTTGADGKFTTAWIIPSDMAPGTCEVDADSMGGSATATFTFSNKRRKQIGK